MILPVDAADDLLEGAGLSEFKQCADVRMCTTGKCSLAVGDRATITIEINRPIQITLTPKNLIADLPRILEALQEKGLRT